MNILVANNHLVGTGGTENYTYALIVELLRLGHKVEYYTGTKGEIALFIENLGVKFRTKNVYDLIIANHTTMIKALNKRGFIIQTCHGKFVELEQPHPKADFHVSITQEVYDHLTSKGYESTIIHNGIDCDRYYPRRKIKNKLETVLSLCQSDKANSFIEECCKELNLNFIKANKFKENIWNLEEIINQADLVVGIGRSLYDAMACGRCVISFDSREYSGTYGDGYLNSENIVESLKYNCSGRGLNKTFTKEEFIVELLKYNPEDGDFFRKFALNKLNIKRAVNGYLNIQRPFKLKLIKYKKYLLLVINYFVNRLRVNK